MGLRISRLQGSEGNMCVSIDGYACGNEAGVEVSRGSVAIATWQGWCKQASETGEGAAWADDHAAAAAREGALQEHSRYE